MIAKEYLKSLTSSEEEGGKITDTTPTKENEVKSSASFCCVTYLIHQDCVVHYSMIIGEFRALNFNFVQWPKLSKNLY